MQIVIDPRSDILYSSYYISAIIDFFGSGNVSFNREPFRTFNVSHKNGFPNLNFVISKEKEEDIRYSIQINDSWRIDEAIYDWCTIYGHVNARLNETPLEQYTKLVPLAPSFGIGFLSVFQTLKLSMQNLIQLKNLKYLYNRPLLHSLRFHFGIYKRCFQRCKLQDYSSEIEPSA